MVAAIPVKTLHLSVRVFLVLGPVVEVRFVQRVVTLEHRIIGDHLLRASATVREFPGALGGVLVARDVVDVMTTLKQQHLEAFFGQLLRGPAAGDTGTYDDCVELRRLCSLHCSSCFAAPGEMGRSVPAPA